MAQPLPIMAQTTANMAPPTLETTTSGRTLINDFKSQYELQKVVQMIATRLSEVHVNGAPIMPNATSTVLNNLLKDMNISATVEAPDLNLELDTNLTLDDV